MYTGEVFTTQNGFTNMAIQNCVQFQLFWIEVRKVRRKTKE